MQRMMTIVVVMLVAAPSARAEGGGLQLADVLAQVHARNPEIQAAEASARAAAQMPAQAAAYDDPVLSYEVWNTPESFDVTRADNNILKLSQKIPFPGKRGLAGRVAARDAEMVGREAERVTLDVLAMTKRAYADLWLAHERLAIYLRDRTLVERSAATAETLYVSGRATQPDVLRARVERTHVATQVTTATLAIGTARAELNALLSRTAEEPLGEPEEPAVFALDDDVEPLVALALERRPELAAQTTAIARAESALSLARRNYLPDFELTLERFINLDHADGLGAMVSVSLPFAYKAKYDAGVGEAEARLAAARAERRRLEDRVRREVHQAHLRVQTAVSQHALFERAHVPQAEQALAATEAAYQAGQVDFLTLIESVRMIQSAHVEHAGATAEFAAALADLERAAGGDLPARGPSHE